MKFRRPFHFRGQIPPSKSVLNRLLLVQAHAPVGTVRLPALAPDSEQCDDVRAMARALAQLHAGQRADCGEAGLVLRLALAYASRRPGVHRLGGSARLMERPHTPLFAPLAQLGVRVSANHDEHGPLLVVESEGWREPRGPIRLDRSVSSQFGSALLLNAWHLDFPLELQMEGDAVSGGYFAMSLEIARRVGMTIESARADRYGIAAHTRPRASTLAVEPDLSSAFAVAALGAVAGYAEIQGFPSNSLQPDRVFPALLAEMGVDVVREADRLIVHRAEKLRPLRASLGDAPDLFPVLATLCALAPGESVLAGAPHLVHKESDRIAATVRLLARMGRQAEALPDGLRILPGSVPTSDGGDFDPVHDHRMVLAATVAQAAGFPIRLKTVDPIDKSFPEFRRIALPFWETTP